MYRFLSASSQSPSNLCPSFIFWLPASSQSSSNLCSLIRLGTAGVGVRVRVRVKLGLGLGTEIEPGLG